jgi:hypothetical protein
MFRCKLKTKSFGVKSFSSYSRRDQIKDCCPCDQSGSLCRSMQLMTELAATGGGEQATGPHCVPLGS